MKKKVLSVLLVAAMTASMFAGCGSSSSDDSSSNTSTGTSTEDGSDATDDSSEAADPVQTLIDSTTGTVTLDLWCSEIDAWQTTMQTLVDNFKAEYSDVNFDITIGAVSEADAKDRILEDVEAAADVFVFADDQVNALAEAGALQSIDATYTYDPSETNTEAAVAAASYNGTLYGYPLIASNGYFLFYNSSIFSEDDVASWESLTAAAEAAGVEVGMDAGNGWYLYGFFAGAGLNVTLNDDGTNSCDWNTETGVAVANSIMNIASSSAFISVGDSDAMAMVAEGTLGAYVSGTWDAATIEAAYGDGYAATKLPTFDVNGTATQMGSYAGYKLVGVNAYSENVGWSMLLAEYISNEASQIAIADATGEGAANVTAASGVSSAALAALGMQSEFADLQRVGDNFWTPAASLGAILVEGTDDVQTALDDAVAGITQAIAAE